MIETKKVLFFTKIIGSVALAKPVVSRMGFAKIIDALVPSDGQQKVSHGEVVEIMVANRLTSPTPLYRVEEWASSIGSNNLYGISAEELNDDRIGRTLDALAPNIMVLKGAIAMDISKRFHIGIEHIHWDFTSFHFTGAYENQTEEYIKISYTKSRPSDSEFTSLQGKPAFKAVKVGLNVANDGKGPVPIFYESLDGNADCFHATIKNMENLKEHLKRGSATALSIKVDRIIRISDKGCFSVKIVAETVKQGFDLIASMKLNEQYIKLLEDSLQRGHHFILLDYLSISQSCKKDPSEQDRYYAIDVESSMTYGIKEYPMRFIFVRSVRKAHQRQRLMDGKIKRDRNRRAKKLKMKFRIFKRK